MQTAEMLKYRCDVFHALKTMSANEIGKISQALDMVASVFKRNILPDISRAPATPAPNTTSLTMEILGRGLLEMPVGRGFSCVAFEVRRHLWYF